jgi:bifunctional non-homologous end joining protein LigD
MILRCRGTFGSHGLAILKAPLLPPLLKTADPKLIRDAFNHEDFIFELKMDGFRALTYTAKNAPRLVSKNGNVMKRFLTRVSAIRREVQREAILDGEIVVLDSEGRPQFYDLLRGRGEPLLYVFDVLWLDGTDLRLRPLLERKRILRSMVPETSSVLLYADHVEGCGIEFSD